jgi:hypothetical protein
MIAKRGTFTACSTLSLTGSSLGLSKDWSALYHHYNALPTISAIKLAWSTNIEEPKFCQHIRNWGLFVLPCINNIFPKCSFCYFCTAFPMTGISSEHLFCLNCWYTVSHFGLKNLSNKDSCQTKLVFFVSDPWVEVNKSCIYWCQAFKCWNQAGLNKGSQHGAYNM